MDKKRDSILKIKVIKYTKFLINYFFVFSLIFLTLSGLIFILSQKINIDLLTPFWLILVIFFYGFIIVSTVFLVKNFKQRIGISLINLGLIFKLSDLIFCQGCDEHIFAIPGGFLMYILLIGSIIWIPIFLLGFLIFSIIAIKTPGKIKKIIAAIIMIVFLFILFNYQISSFELTALTNSKSEIFCFPPFFLGFSNYDQMDECFNIIAVNKQDLKVCEYMEYGGNFCYNDIAVASENESICELEKVSQHGVREHCYWDVGVKKRDINLCYKAGDWECACLSDIAFFDGNESVCDLSCYKDERKQECYDKARAIHNNNLTYCEELHKDEGDFGYDWRMCYFIIAVSTGDESICEFLKVENAYGGYKPYKSCLERIKENTNT
jgi:hypothetical protein